MKTRETSGITFFEMIELKGRLGHARGWRLRLAKVLARVVLTALANSPALRTELLCCLRVAEIERDKNAER